MRKIVLILVLVASMSVTAFALDEGAISTDELAEAAPDEALDRLGDITPSNAGSLSEGVQSILASLAEESGGAIRAAVSTAAVLLGVVLLCALVGQIAPDSPVDAVTLAGVLAITAACAGSLNTLLRLGSETIDQVRVFSNILLPTMSAATIATGATNAAAAISGATVLFSDLLINLISALLLPLVYAYVALRAADAAVGSDTLSRLAGLIAWVITNSLKWLLLGFIAYVSVSGVISGSADSAQIRAAKLAFSGAVPVVGSIIADASETVLVSAGLLRTSMGVFGMLVILGICAYPFLRIGAQYLILKLTAALSAAIGGKRLVGMIDAVSNAMGFLLAMTGAEALMLLISCVCSMKAVSV